MAKQPSPRTRADERSSQGYYEFRIDGVFQTSDTFRRWKYYHWMADLINQKRPDNLHYAPGFCQHLKVDKEFNLGTLTFISKTGDGPAYTLTELGPDKWTLDPGLQKTQSATGSLLFGDVGYSNMAGDFFQSALFQDLCFDAWKKLETQVPTDVEVLSFAYEMKDFIPLAKSLGKAKHLPKDRNISTTLTDPLKGKGKVRKSAKAVNNTFLSYNFMWAPFVSDLDKLTKVSDNVAKRMKFLLDTKGKETTVRFSKQDCYQNSLEGVDQEIGWQNGDFKRTFTVTNYQCDFNVTAKLFQDLEGLTDAFATLRATIAALGINNPANAVWNAIPFSFIVDWIAPFGKWIDRFAVQPFYGVWKVYDITTSVRERYDVEMCLSGRPGGTVQLGRTIIEKVHVDKYTRLVGLPQTLGALDFSQLTSQQQKLFLSLVLTKVL